MRNVVAAAANRRRIRRGIRARHRTELADLVVLLALSGSPTTSYAAVISLKRSSAPGIGVGVVLLGELPVGARQLLLGRRLRTHREPSSSPFRTIHAARALVPSVPVVTQACTVVHLLTRAPAPWPGGSPDPSTCIPA